ncbi:alpha/beta fold hydrolase [Streptomyces virginiae]|uniref:alpha/beta fold hydrolase n=1 Tax=Streptomyces virginiae TaxID=1961 RepID=UPI000ACFE7CB|nr:alpha/beta fold hydrolase [Streptomyces virginiae]
MSAASVHGEVQETSHGSSLSATWLTNSDGESTFVIRGASLCAETVGTVVIIPPFGLSTSDLFIPSYVLQSNGFDVVRFDARNSVGRSSGEILDYTLGSLRRDAEQVLEWIPAPAGPLILVSLSLSSPVAWKVAARNTAVSAVAAIVGVVDVPSTLLSAAGLDVGDYRATDAHEITRPVFGHEVKAHKFVTDMDAEGLDSFAGTRSAVLETKAAGLLLASEDDEYVAVETVSMLQMSDEERLKLRVMAGGSHELGRSPRAFQQAMREVARFCLQIAGVSSDPVTPRVAESISASGAESAFLAQISKEKRTR